MKNYTKAVKIAMTKVNHIEFVRDFYEDIYKCMTNYEKKVSADWDIDTWVAFIVDYADYRFSNIGADSFTIIENNMNYIKLYHSYFK